MESATPCRRRRSSESTKVRPFAFSSLTIINNHWDETAGIRRRTRETSSLYRRCIDVIGDGGGNLIFNERVVGTGGVGAARTIGQRFRRRAVEVCSKRRRKAENSWQERRIGRGKDDGDCERRLCNEPNSVEIKPSPFFARNWVHRRDPPSLSIYTEERTA